MMTEISYAESRKSSFSAEKLLIVDIQLTEVSLSEYEHIMTSVDATVRRIPPTRINVDLIGCV